MPIARYSDNDIPSIRQIVNFFTAQSTNQEEFKEIITICSQASIKNNKGLGIKEIEMGHLSVRDFKNYSISKKLIIENELLLVMDVTKALVEANVLFPIGSFVKAESLYTTRYIIFKNYSISLHSKDLTLNIVLGWEYIVKRYSTSVVKIEYHDKNKDVHIGTGFYYSHQAINVIVSNKHVLQDASEIRVFSKDDHEIIYDRIILDEKRDLAFIKVKEPLTTSAFFLGVIDKVLTDIVTIGYPTIPMTKSAYQVYHKGEINSFVEDYKDNKLFLISAKTSAGNSGSPVINKYGMAVGIVTLELFDQEALEKKGKLPYYAAIPSVEIQKSFNENWKRLQGLE